MTQLIRQRKVIALPIIAGALALAGGTYGVLHYSVWISKLSGRSAVMERTLPAFNFSLVKREIDFYEARVQKNTASFQDLSMLGAIYAGQARLTGDVSLYDRAETLAQASLKRMPASNGAALLVLAQVAQARHQFPQSIALAQKALGEGSHPMGALSLLVTVNLALGKLDEAGRQADTLISIRPGIGTYSLRALVMAAQGRDEEALDDFQSAFRVQDLGDEQEAAWVHSVLGRFQTRHGQFGKAEGELQHALRLVPDYHFALYLMGNLEFQQGHLEQAENFYERAFSSSKQVLYLAALARTKSLLGKSEAIGALYAQAESSIREELAKSAYGHRAELARILMDHPRADNPKASYEEAAALATAELKDRPSAEIYAVSARALFKLGNYKDARIAIQEALRSGAKDPEYFYIAGRLDEALGNPRRGAFWLGRAERLQPDYREFAKIAQPI